MDRSVSELFGLFWYVHGTWLNHLCIYSLVFSDTMKIIHQAHGAKVSYLSRSCLISLFVYVCVIHQGKFHASVLIVAVKLLLILIWSVTHVLSVHNVGSTQVEEWLMVCSFSFSGIWATKWSAGRGLFIKQQAFLRTECRLAYSRVYPAKDEDCGSRRAQHHQDSSVRHTALLSVSPLCIVYRYIVVIIICAET